MTLDGAYPSGLTVEGATAGRGEPWASKCVVLFVAGQRKLKQDSDDDRSSPGHSLLGSERLELLDGLVNQAQGDLVAVPYPVPALVEAPDKVDPDELACLLELVEEVII